MKQLYYLVVASFFSMLSCSENNDAAESQDLALNDFPQTWELTKMTGSIEGSERVGQEMAWQESYLFKSDGSFLKTRITAGESVTASGNYIYESEHRNFLLDYAQTKNITGSCFSDAQEQLYFNEERDILMSTWRECDGPGLFYERID